MIKPPLKIIARRRAALLRAIACFKTLGAFAGALAVDYRVVQGWLRTRVPAEYCPSIEGITNKKVRCEELREDVRWDVLRSSSIDQLRIADESN